jgi:hypothetical protein
MNPFAIILPTLIMVVFMQSIGACPKAEAISMPETAVAGESTRISEEQLIEGTTCEFLF